MIAGRTHPDVARREGERYRLTLERRGRRPRPRGPRRVRRPLPEHRRARRPARRDRRVRDARTASREQISSGALTFALAAGCGVVSTPYWYAEDMLASGAGTIVPFADPPALADAVCRYIEQPESLAAARAEARRIGDELAWPSVAEATAAVLREAVELAPRRRRPVAASTRSSSSVRTDHLLTLVDDVGIVQHANGVIPNRESGYCVDDVARLAVVALELARRGDEQVWTSILYRSLAFLQDATDEPARHAELHGLRPALARRAAHRRPCRPLDLGARGDPLDRLGARPSSARASGCSTRSFARFLNGESSLRTAAYAALGLARLDPDRLEPEARAAAASACVDAAGGRLHARRRPTVGSGSRTTSATTTPASHTRSSSAESRSAATTLTADGLECAPLARRRVRARRGHAAADRPPRAGAASEPAPGDGDEQPLDASAFVEAELAAFAATGDPGARSASAAVRSTGSSAATGSSARCTTSRPVAAATGSATRRRTTTKVPSRRSPSTARALLLDTAGLPRRRTRQVTRRAGARMRRPRELFTPPPGQPDPDRSRLAVSGQRRLQPGRGAASTTRPSLLARVEDLPGHLASHRRALDERHRRLDRSIPSRSSPRGRASRPSSGDSRIRASSASPSSSAGRSPAPPTALRVRRCSSRRPRTSSPSSGTASSGSPRTRTRRCCRNGSTASGSSFTGRGPSSAARRERSCSPAPTTSSAGARRSKSCGRATVPGGTRAESVSGRRRSRPSTAGC